MSPRLARLLRRALRSLNPIANYHAQRQLEQLPALHAECQNLRQLQQRLYAIYDDLKPLCTHPDNLSYALYQEVAFWQLQLRDPQHCNVHERISQSPDSYNHVPRFLVDIFDQHFANLGRKPRALDVGSGPFSTLYYLQRTNRADLLAIDVLARPYAQFVNYSDIPHAAPPTFAAGENLPHHLPPHPFDLVFIANALDHTLCPPLTWLNLYHATAPGGLLAHIHFIREATAEKQLQLHRYDLYPHHENLSIDDLHGLDFSLTDSLPLRKLHEATLDTGGTPAFTHIWEKTADSPPPPQLLQNVLESLRRSFQRRHAWSLHLEHLVNVHARIGTPEYPYTLTPSSLLP